jgi:hypothetical protein
MNKQIRNDEFWLYVPMFVKKHVLIPTLGIEIIGYFPYHTARIRATDHQVCFPRSFLHEFEQIIAISHMTDNKVVYICKAHGANTSPNHFAVMLKDDWATVGLWESVVDYYGKEFTLQTCKHTERDWPCDHCDPTTGPAYCMNVCPLKKEEKIYTHKNPDFKTKDPQCM